MRWPERRAAVNLDRLDLNLLVALRALLEERHVTRAGARIGLSQPAMSAALARLRRHFADELLVRKGNRYELTPLGAALRDPAANAYAMLERLFAARTGFDPATERHEFTLLSSDYGVAVFGTALARAVQRVAPRVPLHFRQVTPEAVDKPESGLGGVDGMLMPHGIVSGLPAVDLYEDEWICLVAADNREVGERLTMDDLARLPWAVYQRAYDTPVNRQLVDARAGAPGGGVGAELPAAALARRGHPPGRHRAAAARPPAPPRRAGAAAAVPVPRGHAARGAVVAPGAHAQRGPRLAARHRRGDRRHPARSRHPSPARLTGPARRTAGATGPGLEGRLGPAWRRPGDDRVTPRRHPAFVHSYMYMCT